jgi:transcriptional regulator with XRE-family HTH domain
MPKRIPQSLPQVNQYEQELAIQIGERVRSRRRELDLSQAQVRERMVEAHVFVSRTQLSRIENGEALPNAADIIGLCLILAVSPNWLLCGGEALG